MRAGEPFDAGCMREEEGGGREVGVEGEGGGKRVYVGLSPVLMLRMREEGEGEALGEGTEGERVVVARGGVRLL